jgi:hypothetical protein
MSAQYCLISAFSGWVRIREKLLLFEGVKLHPEGESPLQLGNEVAGFAHVEGAGSDEENVGGVDNTVLGVHGTALDDRQNVPLDPLPTDVAAAASIPGGDLVDLVNEDDPGILDPIPRQLRRLLRIDELVHFLLQEVFPAPA